MKEVKKVKIDLVGMSGNAFAILAAFQSRAKKQGWTQEEIKAVIDEARSGDYDKLLQVIVRHCE